MVAIYFQTSFEQISVNNRFINIPGIVNPNVFDNQRFVEQHSNTVLKIMISLISISMISIAGTWKMNVNDTKRNH
jgi:hypothetical protein